MKKTKASPQSRLFRIITVPVRALGKARDMYVKSMTDSVDLVRHSKPARGRSTTVSGLPKSFSVNSAPQYDSEDFRELVRAASARSLGNRSVDREMGNGRRTIKAKAASGGPPRMPPRSSSVAMGRIDEESATGEDGEINSGMHFKKELSYQRSKSHAITSTRRIAF